MSSCRGSVYLLVLLGAVFIHGKTAIPLNVSNSLDIVKDALKLTEAEVNIHPLFDSIVRNVDNFCQRCAERQLMNATLDVYIRIFANILSHSHHNHQNTTQKSDVLDQLNSDERSKVIQQLDVLKRKMEELKRNLNCSSDKEDAYSMLKKLKVDDPLVQKKALAEFLGVYEAASSVIQRS